VEGGKRERERERRMRERKKIKTEKMSILNRKKENKIT